MNVAISAVTAADARGFFEHEWHRETETHLPDWVFEVTGGTP